MVRLTTDSVKILLPADAIEPGFSYFSKKARDKSAGHMPGLQSIIASKDDRREAVIEVSSKILPGPELIHRGNIEEVLAKVNESKCIVIRPNAIEQAYCLTVDPAIDLVIPNSQELLETISVLAYHPQYRKKSHRGTNNTTFYYEGSNRGKYAGKAKIYDKSAEDKTGIYAPDTVRCEVTCPTGKSIQHRFGVGANSQGRVLLTDVLESKKNPVADTFEFILASLYAEKEQPGTGMEVLRTVMGINKEEVFRRSLKTTKEINFFNMLLTHHYDLNLIYGLLRRTIKSNTGKGTVLKPYLAMLNKYQEFNEEATIDYELLMSLRERLRNPSKNTTGPLGIAA